VRSRRGRLRGALADASLRARVMAAAAILVALTSLVSGFLGTALLSSYLYSRSDTQLRDFAKIASSILDRSHVPAQNGQLPAQFLVELSAPTGRSSPRRHRRTPRPARGCPRRSSGTTTARSPCRRARPVIPGGYWSYRSPAGARGHRVSLDDLNSTVTRLEIADALAGAVAIAVLAGLGLPLVRASLAPLGRIEAAYQARAEGEARALRSEERMRQFVADASHELRTPLTSVSGLAQFGLQQGDAASPGELLRLMALIQHEASRMGRLVEDLLVLAKFDTDRPLDRHHLDLASIAAQAVQAARVVNPDRPITLRAGEPVIVYADTERLRQVIDNLIGNATQHTPPQSPVTVSVISTTGTGEVIVADDGPGMTAEQAAHIFERFYRTDGARSRARGGTGLGLSIAASLAAAHGGDITVDTKPGQGAAFHVRLPLAASVESETST
jgi:signal transduction histidine kinase